MSATLQTPEGADHAGYSSLGPNANHARVKKFRLNGYIYEQFSGKGVLSRVPFFTPREDIFELFFFCHMFDKAVKNHPLRKRRLHVTLLHSQSQQLLHSLELDHYKTEDELAQSAYSDEDSFCFFGRHAVFMEEEWIPWELIRDELLETGHPIIILSFAERIYKTLEDFTSSILAGFYFIIIIVVTIVNLAGICLPGVRSWVASHLLHIDKDTSEFIFHTCCMYIFTFDFLAKILLVPWVRVHCVDVDLLKGIVADANSILAAVEYSWQKKLQHFVMQPGNVVDFIAIVPYWISTFLGEVHINTSFLRLFRLARIFRLLRTARHFQLFQVLTVTLVRSASMVFILICLMGILGLICGCLLQQFESGSEHFQTVPLAWFWIITRLISIKDVPGQDGQVYSKAGITLLVLVMSTKGVLMILPIARIKTIFVEEFTTVTEVAKMKSDLWYELLHRTVEDNWSGHQGLAWGRIHLLNPRGDVTRTAQFALPILLGKSVHVPLLKVRFPHGFFDLLPTVNVTLVWDEDNSGVEIKQKGAPVMPKGVLKVHLYQPHSIPKDAVFRVDVPFQIFGYTSRKCKLDEELVFTIDWHLGGKGFNAPKHSSSKQMLSTSMSVRNFSMSPRSELHDDSGEIRQILDDQFYLLQRIAEKVGLTEAADDDTLEETPII